MDYTTIIVTAISTIFGSAFIWTLVANIRYRKQLKRQKEAQTQKQEIEVKDQSVEHQKKEMELVDLYKDKVFELIEDVYKETKKNGVDNTAIIQRIDELSEEVKNVKKEVKTLTETVEEVKEEQSLQASFLNGELTKFREMQKRLAERNKSENVEE